MYILLYSNTSFFVHFLSWDAVDIHSIYTTSLFPYICLSLIYEQVGGAVYTTNAGASGTFIRCSWTGNSARYEVSITCFKIFSLLQQISLYL